LPDPAAPATVAVGGGANMSKRVWSLWWQLPLYLVVVFYSWDFILHAADVMTASK
jgi:hypothetical protein